MEFGILLIRLILAGVFVVAGIAKLADLAGSRQAMRDFGVPEVWAGGLGLALPVAELLVALALLPATTAWWGAWGAIVLLVGFIGGIVYNMARGQRPNCHCFGQLHSAPIGWPTLLRNSILAMMALAVVARGPQGVGPSALGWLFALSGWGYAALAGGLVVLTLLVGQSWVVWNLLRQNGRLILRVEALETHLGLVPLTESAQGAPTQEDASPVGLPLGTPAPAFTVVDLAGGSTSLGDLVARAKPMMLIFSSPGCGACTDLLPEIATWQQTHAARMTIALINRGDVAAVRAKLASFGLDDVYMQADNEVGDAFGVTGTPSAVLIDARGAVRSPLAAGANAVRALMRQGAGLAVGQMLLDRRRAPIALDDGSVGTRDLVQQPAAPPNAVTVGMSLPSFDLLDLTGAMVASSTLHGRPTVLLFWNPNCGFCQRMATQLHAWEAEHAAAASPRPQLVLIATGSAEANQTLRLRAPILLDETFATGRSLGVQGTPSALLVDAQGTLASEVVVGANNVMALLRPPASEPNQLIAQPVAA